MNGVEAAKRLLEGGRDAEARTQVLEALATAEECNDRAAVACSVLLLGVLCAREGKLGRAAARHEYAAELFRGIGDTTHEMTALEQLARCYRGLGDEQAAGLALARRKVIVSSVNRGREEQQGESSKANVRGGPKLLGIFGAGPGTSQQEQLEAIEDGKAFLRGLAAAHGTNADDNEMHMQQHLTQVHFEDLPFMDVELRVQENASASLEAVESRVRRYVASLREAAAAAGPGGSEVFARYESPGSLRRALERWADAADEWGAAAERTAAQIKSDVLAPLGKMRQVHKMMCDRLVATDAALGKKARQAQRALELEKTSLERAQERLAELQQRWELVNSAEGKAVPKTLSESMGDIIGKKMTVQDRVEANLIKARAEVASCQDAVAHQEERVAAAEGGLRAGRKRTCLELETIEQARIEGVAALLRRLAALQEELLSEWQGDAARVRGRLEHVDSASDLRTFCNRSLVHSVLLGRALPSALFASSRRQHGKELEGVLETRLARARTASADTLTEEPELAELLSAEGVEAKPRASSAPGHEAESDSEGPSTATEDDAEDESAKAKPSERRERPLHETPLSPRSPGAMEEPTTPAQHREEVDALMDMLAGRPASLGRAAVLASLCEGFQVRSTRRYFLLRLNRCRSTNTCVTPEQMQDLVLLFIAFLDAVYIQGDVRAAKMALILSETFYCPGEAGEAGEAGVAGVAGEEAGASAAARVYIQDGIKDHGIWRSAHFWEETFFLAVREEIHRNVVRTQQDGASSRRRSLSASNFRNIAFGQISSSAFNMLSVGLSLELVRGFVERMCAGSEIGEEETARLAETLLAS